MNLPTRSASFSEESIAESSGELIFVRFVFIDEKYLFDLKFVFADQVRTRKAGQLLLPIAGSDGRPEPAIETEAIEAGIVGPSAGSARWAR